jgi:bifunctional DNA-binding transcriptional regulator/antitoxin component of YhaV-PrlF toxin-antitoxin module
MATYKHRSGSRKEQVHRCFDRDGKDKAMKLGLSLGLAKASLTAWFSTWRNQVPPLAEGSDTMRDGGVAKVRLGPDGRVVVPAAIREALSLNEGDVLYASIEGEGEVRLSTPRAAMRRVQAMVREFVPEGVSLVDELLEDRRREVEAEAAKD